MKKILCFSLGRSGGSVKYAKCMIDALDNIENVETYVSSFCEVDTPVKSKKIIAYKSILTFLLSTLLLLPIYIFILFFRLLIIRDVKAVYFPYFHYWSVPIILVCKVCSVRVISTVHDGILHLGDGKPFEQILNQYYVCHSDKLIFLTEHVANNVMEHFKYSSPKLVLPHGLIGEDYNFEHLNKFEKKNVLFFGRVSEYKGVETLLEAVSGLDSELYSELFIVGRSQYDVNYSLFRHDQKKLIVVDEFINESEVKEYFDKASVLVLPYIEATQSGVLMLGVSSLTPMIISDCGGLKEQLDDNEAIFYQNNDKNKLTEAITTLLTQPQVYTEYQSSLLEKSKSLDWTLLAKRLIQAFSE